MSNVTPPSISDLLAFVKVNSVLFGNRTQLVSIKSPLISRTVPPCTCENVISVFLFITCSEPSVILFPQSTDSKFVIKLIPLTIIPGNKSLVLSTSNLLVLISVLSSQSSHGSLCISKSMLFLIVFVFSILPENRIPISISP